MATEQEAFRRLRLVITSLISDLATIERVLDDAEIDSSSINLTVGVQNVWHNALKEAIKQNRLAALIDIIYAEYNNYSLVAAYREYLQAQGHLLEGINNNFDGTKLNRASGSESVEPESPVVFDSSGSHVTINTGGGPYIAGNVNTGGDFVGWEQNKKEKDATASTEATTTHPQDAVEKISSQFEGLTPKVEGLTFTQGLWPLEAKGRFAMSGDANYDFPTSEERFLDLGENQIYHVSYEQSNEDAALLSQAINAEELCTSHLLNSAHQLIVGRRSAGKTWLRLYLERYVLITNAAPPPVFVVTPTQLQFRATEVEIVRWLARSVAQQLFLRLFTQAYANQEEMDPILVILGGIAPFLKEYGYDLYEGQPFLARPMPAILQSSLDDSYRNNPIYRQMKQLIEVATPLATTYAVEPMLNDLQKTLEILDYRRLLLLIDNWDRIAEPSRNALVTQFLSPPLLAQLKKRKLFLKVFVPTIPTESLSHFQQAYQLERRVGNEKYRLSLYSHDIHESATGS